MATCLNTAACRSVVYYPEREACRLLGARMADGFDGSSEEAAMSADRPDSGCSLGGGAVFAAADVSSTGATSCCAKVRPVCAAVESSGLGAGVHASNATECLSLCFPRTGAQPAASCGAVFYHTEHSRCHFLPPQTTADTDPVHASVRGDRARTHLTSGTRHVGYFVSLSAASEGLTQASSLQPACDGRPAEQAVVDGAYALSGSATLNGTLPVVASANCSDAAACIALRPRPSFAGWARAQHLHADELRRGLAGDVLWEGWVVRGVEAATADAAAALGPLASGAARNVSSVAACAMLCAAHGRCVTAEHRDRDATCRLYARHPPERGGGGSGDAAGGHTIVLPHAVSGTEGGAVRPMCIDMDETGLVDTAHVHRSHADNYASRNCSGAGAGWVGREADGWCYKHFGVKSTRDGAAVTCASAAEAGGGRGGSGAGLATAVDAAAHEFVLSLVPQGEAAWLANRLDRHTNLYRLADGTASPFSNFAPAASNYAKHTGAGPAHQGECVALHRQGGRNGGGDAWYDVDCHLQFGFVCTQRAEPLVVERAVVVQTDEPDTARATVAVAVAADGKEGTRLPVPAGRAVQLTLHGRGLPAQAAWVSLQTTAEDTHTARPGLPTACMPGQTFGAVGDIAAEVEQPLSPWLLNETALSFTLPATFPLAAGSVYSVCLSGWLHAASAPTRRAQYSLYTFVDVAVYTTAPDIYARECAARAAQRDAIPPTDNLLHT